MAPKRKVPIAKDKASKENPDKSSSLPVANDDAVDKLEEELLWCIQHLDAFLTTSKDAKQNKNADSILKILTSSKAPLVKKRQAMRSYFGDYRQKMNDERKEFLPAKSKIVSPDNNHSKYLRSCAQTKSTSATENDFRFNFQYEM